MKHLIFTLLLVSIQARADWFCTEEASQRRGNAIVACGRGQDQAQAFKEAEAEFHRVCSASADCRGHDVVVSPKRTECTAQGCVRMVAFEIQESSKDIQAQLAANEEPAIDCNDDSLWNQYTKDSHWLLEYCGLDIH